MVIRFTPRACGQRAGGGDFGVQQFGRHRPAGDHAKAARVADGGHQIAFETQLIAPHRIAVSLPRMAAPRPSARW
jgi:hypothetical protein